MEDRWLELAGLFESTEIRGTLANQRKMEELIELTAQMLEQDVDFGWDWDLKDYLVKFLVDRGRMSSDRGERTYAKDWYLKALEHKHPSTTARYHWVRALVNWGVILYKEGEVEKALEIWEKICEDFKTVDHPELQEGLVKTHINLFHGKKKKLNLAKLPPFVNRFLRQPYEGVRLALTEFFLGYSWPYNPDDSRISLLLYLVTGNPLLIKNEFFSDSEYQKAYSFFDSSKRKQLLQAPHVVKNPGIKQRLLLTQTYPLHRYEEEALGPGVFPKRVFPEIQQGDEAEQKVSRVEVLLCWGEHWISLHQGGEVFGSVTEGAEELEERLGALPGPWKSNGSTFPLLILDAQGMLFLLDQSLQFQRLSEEGGFTLIGQGSSCWAYQKDQGIYELKGKKLGLVVPWKVSWPQPSAMGKVQEDWIWGDEEGRLYKKGKALPKARHKGRVSVIETHQGSWASYGEDKKVFWEDQSKAGKIHEALFKHKIEGAAYLGGHLYVLTQEGLFRPQEPQNSLCSSLTGGISLSHQGDFLLAGDKRGKVHFFKEKKEALEYLGARIGHGDWPRVFCKKGKDGLLSGALNGSVLEWDLNDLRVRASHCPAPAHHLGHWKGNLWFTLGENYLLFWKNTWEPMGIFSGQGSMITAVASSSGGKYLALGEEKGHLHLLRNEKEKALSFDLGSPLLSLVWKGEDKLAYGLWDGRFGFWEEKKKPRELGQCQGPVLSLIWLNKGLITGDNQGFIRFWDEDGQEIWCSEPMGEAITTLAIDQEESHIYAGGGKGSVLILDPLEGLLLGEWQERGKTIWNLETKGNILSVRREGKDAMLWLLPGFGNPLSLRGHRQKVESLVILPRGEALITASGDGYLRLWRLPDGELVRKIPGPKEGIGSLALNKEGTELWALSKNGSPLKFPLGEGLD